jgi:hypothetical protein
MCVRAVPFWSSALARTVLLAMLASPILAAAFH